MSCILPFLVFLHRPDSKPRPTTMTTMTAPLSFHRAQILANSAYLFPQHPPDTLQVVTTYSRHADEHTGAHVVDVATGAVLLSFTDAAKISELRRSLNCTFVDPALYWLYIEVQCLVEEKMFHGVAVGAPTEEGMEGGGGGGDEEAVTARKLQEELESVRGELEALKRRRSSRRTSRRGSDDAGVSSPRKVPRFVRSENGRLVEEGGEFLMVERERE
ncbi:hypothetical protein EDC01DRAFT_779849 [Geopyxis carbonaria]|nr:hypothetical protein EDC01DRAFT_779849 [Geopyxis carbonaria]